ncbi:DUF4340 domain-containing protein [Dokdonella sp.]|uniref:DUF4340 domain-containing protein n=1 Tax=Dokdonella sp. TaxID=2291710 RepID=UPI0031BC83F9|nr:DUF4340 domain-containing protein [Dokdonella sp.]
MGRRGRQLFLLAGLAVLLGGTVLWQQTRERATLADPLTHVDATSVRSLAVDCRGCTPRRYARTADGWQMTAPDRRPADMATVERLLAIARAPVRARQPRSAFDLAKIGLDPPIATLVLDGVTLAFGTTDAIDHDRYVAVGGDIALVPDRFSAALFMAPADWQGDLDSGTEQLPASSASPVTR